jgi:hypothetical protein
MHVSSNYMEELRAAKFRFQDLKIWQSAIEISNELFNIAEISLKARVPHQKRILKIS